uniref:Reverse transcriptase domain-containing protein n=1 Tax=Tanacetum cinerariifolium TaxID=118510 RepID=A0A6L2NNU3_TANCI|nr:reverse transcriptase domain-containing protein [Tanacetum cinerariifolium]
MTRITVKRLTKPLDEPEREFQRLRRATWHLQQNESLAIARRNLFDDEASSSNNTGTKPPTPPKTLHEHSHPNSSDFQNPIILPAERTGRIVDSRDILLMQRTCTFQGLRSDDPLRHIKHYLSIVDNIQADRATRDTSRSRFFHFSPKGKAATWQNNPAEQPLGEFCPGCSEEGRNDMRKMSSSHKGRSPDGACISTITDSQGISRFPLLRRIRRKPRSPALTEPSHTNKCLSDYAMLQQPFSANLEKMLRRCEETNLVLNWEKCHFMVKEGIVLGHKVARPMTQLLVKDAPFNFSEECIQAFEKLKRELTQAPIMIKPDWSLPFEVMCYASDYDVGAVLGQRIDKHFKPIH